MLKKVNRALVTSIFGLLLSFTMMAGTISAASGTWTSGAYTDWDGSSQVGTTRNSAGAETVTLEVFTGSGDQVGYKRVGIIKDQTVEHTCWGQPLLARYGKVTIKGSHSPWFYA